MINKERNLSYEISQIKQRNRYGLIEISPHALSRMEQRNIDKDIILDCISKRDTTIIQHHPPYTYHNNTDDLFVLYAKVCIHNQPKPIHVIIAKSNQTNDVIKYTVVTCYIPSKSLFYAHGRKLKHS